MNKKQNIKKNKQASEELIIRKNELIANTCVEVEDLQKTISQLLEENEELSNQISDFDSVEKRKNKLLFETSRKTKRCIHWSNVLLNEKCYTHKYFFNFQFSF